jgi:hypothetical protein
LSLPFQANSYMGAGWLKITLFFVYQVLYRVT